MPIVARKTVYAASIASCRRLCTVNARLVGSFSIATALVLCSMASGCSSWIPRPEPNPDTPYGHDPRASPGKLADDSRSNRDVPSAVQLFLERDNAAQQSGSSSADILKYLDSGFGLSDTMCSEWFNSIEASRESAEYREGTAGLTGALTGTLMGLFKSAPNEIGAAAAVFGGVSSWYKLGKATFFLTPKLGTVRTKTRELRESMANDIRSNETIVSSYELARRALVQYQDTCGILALQQFVENATDLAKYEYTPAGQLDPAIREKLKVLATKLLKQIAWPDPDADIAPEIWGQVYVTQFDPELAGKMDYPKAGTARQLNEAFSKALAAAASEPANSDPKSDLETQLVAIASLLKLDKAADDKKKAFQELSDEEARELAAIPADSHEFAAKNAVKAANDARIKTLKQSLVTPLIRSSVGEFHVVSTN